MLRIETDILITGVEDDVVKNGCVMIDGEKIDYAGPIEGAPKTVTSDISFSVPVVMPGMWEAHGHLSGLKTADLTEAMRTPVQVPAARWSRTPRRFLLQDLRA